MSRLKVVDGVPYRLRGVRERGAAIVKFIHRCCDCGLRHNVKIKHKDGDSGMEISFNRKEKQNEN